MRCPSIGRLTILLTVFVLAGCGPGKESKSPPPKSEDSTRPPAKPEDSAKPPAETEKPANADRADKADVAALVQGNNEFTLDLYRRLADAKGNLFISPFSVGAAVSLTFANNDGDALASGLHIPFAQDRLNVAYAGLIWKLLGEGRPRSHELSIANAIWLTNRQDFKPSPDYIKLARDNYAAPPHSVDFLGSGVKEINDWCADKTRQKIKGILQAGDVDDQTVAVLTNAVYFKGDWKYKFLKDQTYAGYFALDSKYKVDAKLMQQMVEVRYEGFTDAQVLELPYKGDDMSMLIVLPSKTDGLRDVEKRLTARQLKEWTDSLRTRKVHVTLPRFKVEGERIELKKMLSELNLPMDAAPNIGTPPTGLSISHVYHRGFVEVNEEGSEAAAVTAVKVVDKPAGDGDTTVDFRADHPFLFMIRDNRTGCVLFIGRMAEPK